MMECEGKQHRRLRHIYLRHIYLRIYILRHIYLRIYTQAYIPKNAEEVKLNECQFADDAALLTTSKRGAEQVTNEYMHVAKNFGLTLSIVKTKVMAVGREVTSEDRTPMKLGEEEIQSVNEFPYLGSQADSSGRMAMDMERWISQASKAFGALRKPVLLDHNLKISTRRKVYQACVLSVLLYGSECWTPLKRELKKLDSFHNSGVRTIMGISNAQQWSQRITLAEIRQKWGDTKSATVKVTKRRLKWLGHVHVARMPE